MTVAIPSFFISLHLNIMEINIVVCVNAQLLRDLLILIDITRNLKYNIDKVF